MDRLAFLLGCEPPDQALTGRTFVLIVGVVIEEIALAKKTRLTLPEVSGLGR